MKRISLIVVALFCALISSTSYAQALEEVTLTVSSDGPTKDEAVKNALRSAIEQAYGTFVSANTTILNDELVKDEIVTVSNGSIKDYKELACSPAENGKQFVTVRVTVSLPQLIKYSKSKGSECEFAGNTFGMQMKLFELQRKNELKALYNLTNQIVAILPTTMHHIIEVGEPRIPKKSDWIANYREGYAQSANDSYSDMLYDDYFFLRFDPFTVPKDHRFRIATLNNEAKQIYTSTINSFDSYYEVPIKISWFPVKVDVEVDRDDEDSLEDIDFMDEFSVVVKEKLPIIKTIDTVLGSLSLSNAERESLRTKGLSTATLYMNIKSYNFRNEPDSIYKWALDFQSKIFNKGFCNFVIVDNTGQRSTFFPIDILNRILRIKNQEYDRSSEKVTHYLNEISDKSPVMLNRSGLGLLGEGLYHNLFRLESTYNLPHSVRGPSYNYEDGVFLSLDLDCYWETIVLIPKSEIGKYSNFKVEPAN